MNVEGGAEESSCPPDKWMLLSAFVHTSVHVSSLSGLPGVLLPAVCGLLIVTVLISLLWAMGLPCLAVEGISYT